MQFGLLSVFIKTLLLLFLVTACAPKRYAVVEDRVTLNERQETEKIGGRLIRIVRPGDTLYSISFANNLDVNALAQWNGIDNVRHVPLGKRLRLTEPIGFKEKKRALVKVGSKHASQEKNNANVVSSSVDGSGVSYQDNKSEEVKKRVVKKRVPESSVIKPKEKTLKVKVPQASVGAWLWPIKGRIVERYVLAKNQQGISIQSARGQAVLASKAGEVVYVGNALKGYGNLIIIKHSEQFLSAYAHNAKIFVVEGQKIHAKQKIGTTGLDNKRRQALHFQIRKNGRPVNPLTYLPKR